MMCGDELLFLAIPRIDSMLFMNVPIVDELCASRVLAPGLLFFRYLLSMRLLGLFLSELVLLGGLVLPCFRVRAGNDCPCVSCFRVRAGNDFPCVSEDDFARVSGNLPCVSGKGCPCVRV